MTNSLADPKLPFDPKTDDMFVAHDPLAVAHAIYCPSPVERRSLQQQSNGVGSTFNGWSIQPRRFGVETEGSLTRGFCVTDRRRLGSRKKGISELDREASSQQPDSISSVATAKQPQASTAPAKEEHRQPSDGEWDVIVASPGIDWFARLFCAAMGV